MSSVLVSKMHVIYSEPRQGGPSLAVALLFPTRAEAENARTGLLDDLHRNAAKPNTVVPEDSTGLVVATLDEYLRKVRDDAYGEGLAAGRNLP
jgi:hypothetical protein